jgi:hypothetical protein
MKKLLLIFALLMASRAFAQQGNTITIMGSGAPAGSCSFIFRYIDSTNNNLYFCSNGSWVLANGGGGGGAPGGSTDAVQYNAGGGTFGGLNSPTTNGPCQVFFNVTASAAVAPTCALPGVTVNAQSGNYALLYTDRAAYLKFSGGTTATLTLPQVTGPTASNFPFVLQNLNTGNLSVCANAADQIDGGTTGGCITILPNYAVFVYQDSSSAPGNWWTVRLPNSAAPLPAATGNFLQVFGGTTAIASTPAQNTTKCWAYMIPSTITTTHITVNLSVADNTGNLYDFGFYGPGPAGVSLSKVGSLGATAGTVLSPSTGIKTWNWAAGFTLYGNNRYWFCETTNAASAAMQLSGQNNQFSINANVNPSSNNSTSGGVLNAAVTLPADATPAASGTMPMLTIW